MVEDLGNYIFNMTGGIRAITLPTTHWAYNQLSQLISNAPRLSNKEAEKLNIFEKELINAISTGIFVEKLPIPGIASHAMLPIAAVPLVRLGLQHVVSDYPGPASYPVYRETYPDNPELALGLAGMEATLNSVNLGSSLYAIAYFLVDSFYDSTHESDLPWKNELFLGMAALGAVIGLASMADERAYRASSYAATSMQMFYLTCMPLISMAFCLAPSLENMNTFMDSSIYVIMGIAAFSMLASGIYTYLAPDYASARQTNTETNVSQNYGTFFRRTAINERDDVEAPSPLPSPRGNSK